MEKAMGQELLSYVREHGQEMLSLLRHLVEAETPTGAPEAHQPLLPILSSALLPLNYRVQTFPGEGYGEHFYAYPSSYREGAPAQLLLGHYDTVWPAGTLESMPMVMKDGKLSGPGVLDMKAGLVQGIFALHALHRLGITPTLAPLWFVGSDEESGSPTSRPLIEELSKRVERAYVLEPAMTPQGHLKTARKGVGRFRIVVTGVAAHAGLDPEKGESAIVELAHVIQQLEALHRAHEGISINVGSIKGGVNANVIAPESEALVDVRVETQEQARWIEAQLLGLQPTNKATTLAITGHIHRPPMEQTARNDRLWRIAQERGEWLGLELEEATAGGGSDGSIASLYTATLDGLGAVGDGAHAPHEYISVEQMFVRCALLALLLCAPSETH